MILNNRKTSNDEPVWEAFETKLKGWMYAVMHESLECQICTPILFKFFTFIETLQFFWYAIHERFGFLWTTGWITVIRDGIKYFQIDSLLENGSQVFFLTTLYIVFGIQLIMVGVSIYVGYKLAKYKKKTSSLLTYSIKIFSLYALMVNTVLAMPFYQIFAATLYCNSNDNIHKELTCYQGLYFLHLVVASIGIIFLTIFALLFTLFYIDLNPNSKIPFAGPQNQLTLIKLGLKILLPACMVLDLNSTMQKQFIVFYGLAWLLVLYFRYDALPYYNKSVDNFVVICEITMLWVCGVSNIHAFIDLGSVDNIGLFFLVVGIPFVAYTYLKILDAKKWGIITTEIKNIKKDRDFEYYTLIFLHLIDRRDQPTPRIQLEGMLKYHVKHCLKKDEGCECTQLTREYLKDDENPEKVKFWNGLAKTVISYGSEKFPKVPMLHILNAFIEHERLQNKFKALYELMMAEENKPNFQEQFAIYRYKNLIEEEMVENDLRSIETKGIDVNVIVSFQNKFVSFQSSIEKSVNLHLDFWKELLEESPDIQKLQALGSKITNSVEENSEKFKKLCEINTNHIKCLNIYGNFLKDIVNDENEGQKILEKADYVYKSSMVNKQFVDNDRLKYGENSNTCIITLSGNYNSMGVITSINNEITRILQYSKNDISGQNINKIMTKAYADHHDGLMKRYFKTSIPKVIGSERLVMPINKQGYIVPCTLMIKILPNLDEGIRAVGFLKDIESGFAYQKSDFEPDENVHYLMYGEENGVIHGITNSCYQSFGIPLSLMYGTNNSNNEFKMESIFPDISTQNLEDLKSPSGLILTLDTTNIRQTFLSDNNQDDVDNSPEDHQDDEQDDERQSKYKKVKIRAILVQEDDFSDITIKTLKFVEVNELDDVNKQRSVGHGNQGFEDQEQGKGDNNQNAEEQKQEDAHQSAEDIEKSDRSSNISGSSVNDEMRQLKDFKALISEKTVPKSIKVLKRTILVLGAIFIILTSVELSLRFSTCDELNQGAYSTYKAYQRHDYIANVNFNIRYLYLLATNMVNLTMIGLSSSNYELYLKNNLLSLIDSLQTIQFDVIKARIRMQSLSSDQSSSDTYPIVELLQSNQTRNENVIYNDALFQYITAASSIRNSSLSSFNSTSDIESTIKNLYFVVQNGLGSLRYGSEQIASTFYNFYYNRTNHWLNINRIFMILKIGFVLLGLLILVPIVFSVLKTNNKVLSLFGYIPSPEITELVNKCEVFILNHLEDRQEKKEFSFDQSEDEDDDKAKLLEKEKLSQSNVDQNEETNNKNDESFTTSQNINGKLDEKQANNAKKPGNTLQLPSPHVKSSKKDDDANKSTNNQEANQNKQNNENYPQKNLPTAKSMGKKKNKVGNNGEYGTDIDVLNEKMQKLLNSKANKRRGILLKFTTVSIIYILYFVIDFVIGILFLSDTQSTFQHLQYLCIRSPNLRFLNLFTLEQFVQAQNLTFSDMEGDNSIDYYMDATYSNEGSISTSIKQAFPSDFSAYVATFLLYNLNDTCQYAYASQSSSISACQAINSGLISKGLQTSLLFMVEEDRDITSNFLGSQMQQKDIYNAINSFKFNSSTQIMYYTMPALDQLLNIYNSAFQSFLNTSLNNEKIIFTVFIIFLVFVFIFIWSPYLRNLSNKIWKTKGMLNMIPMEIITKNDNLKNLFISGDLLQAVK